MPSKREIEQEISKAVIRFEKDYMGRGPLETKALIYHLDERDFGLRPI